MALGLSLLDVPKLLWSMGRKIEKLLALQTKITASLLVVDERLRVLEDRMTHLEANPHQVVTEARAAASAASTIVAAAIISDVVTRITRIEMRAEDSGRRQPPP